MPFNIDATVFIPKDKINSDLLRCMGFTEKEIRDFYEKDEVPVTVDTSIHDMKDIEFDEYEDVL